LALEGCIALSCAKASPGAKITATSASAPRKAGWNLFAAVGIMAAVFGRNRGGFKPSDAFVTIPAIC
jgi:hypothetical protein